MPETTFPLLMIQGTADMVARVKYVLGPSLVLVMAEPRASRPGVDGRIQSQQIDLRVRISRLYGEKPEAA